jgi:hypothetical protein
MVLKDAAALVAPAIKARLHAENARWQGRRYCMAASTNELASYSQKANILHVSRTLLS